MIPTTDDWEIMAKTIWGEARGEPFEGQVAVGWVIRNRAAAGTYGRTIEEVCTRPLQFSAWNADDPNRKRMLVLVSSDPVYRRSLGIAALILSGDLPDYGKGAVNYHATSITPEWASRMVPTVTIGSHRFYREVES